MNCRFRKLSMLHPPKDERLRKKYYANKLSILSDRVIKKQEDDVNIDDFLKAIDLYEKKKTDECLCIQIIFPFLFLFLSLSFICLTLLSPIFVHLFCVLRRSVAGAKEVLSSSQLTPMIPRVTDSVDDWTLSDAEWANVRAKANKRADETCSMYTPISSSGFLAMTSIPLIRMTRHISHHLSLSLYIYINILYCRYLFF